MIFENIELLDQFKILHKNFTRQTVLFYAYLTAAVLPYSECKFEKNKQTPSLISYIIKEAIKVKLFYGVLRIINLNFKQKNIYIFLVYELYHIFLLIFMNFLKKYKFFYFYK